MGKTKNPSAFCPCPPSCLSLLKDARASSDAVRTALNDEARGVQRRLREQLSQVSTEVGLFMRLMYKNKDQHRRSLYYRRLSEVRRSLQMLSTSGLEDTVESFSKFLRVNRPDGLISKGAAQSKSNDVVDEVKALRILLGVARLLNQIDGPIIAASSQIAGLLGQSFFMPFAVTMFSCLARFRVLLIQVLYEVVTAFNLLSAILQSKQESSTQLKLECVHNPGPRLPVQLTCQWKGERLFMTEKKPLGVLEGGGNDSHFVTEPTCLWFVDDRTGVMYDLQVPTGADLLVDTELTSDVDKVGSIQSIGSGSEEPFLHTCRVDPMETVTKPSCQGFAKREGNNQEKGLSTSYTPNTPALSCSLNFTASKLDGESCGFGTDEMVETNSGQEEIVCSEDSRCLDMTSIEPVDRRSGNCITDSLALDMLKKKPLVTGHSDDSTGCEHASALVSTGTEETVVGSDTFVGNSDVSANFVRSNIANGSTTFECVHSGTPLEAGRVHRSDVGPVHMDANGEAELVLNSHELETTSQDMEVSQQRCLERDLDSDDVQGIVPNVSLSSDLVFCQDIHTSVQAGVQKSHTNAPVLIKNTRAWKLLTVKDKSLKKPAYTSVDPGFLSTPVQKSDSPLRADGTGPNDHIGVCCKPGLVLVSNEIRGKPKHSTPRKDVKVETRLKRPFAYDSFGPECDVAHQKWRTENVGRESKGQVRTEVRRSVSKPEKSANDNTNDGTCETKLKKNVDDIFSMLLGGCK